MNIKTLRQIDAGAESSFNVHKFGDGEPQIAITAGIHGNEVTGIYVAERLIEFLEENPPITGSINVIPRVNPTATRCLKRCSPFDSEDLNRIFPGSAHKSLSHKIAAALWEETQAAIYLIDLHCCGQHSLPYVLSIYDESEKALELAKLIPLNIAVKSYGTEGQLFTESCHKRDQAALIIELPSGRSSGAINLEAAEKCFDALLSMLMSLGVVSGEPEAAANVYYGYLLDIEADAPGLWRPSISTGDCFENDQIIGSLNGEPILAPAHAMALAVQPCSYVFMDDPCVVTYIEPDREYS